MPDLSHPPGTPANVVGFLNLGGEALAVVDAAFLFGVASDASVDPVYRHILIAGAGPGAEDARLGLLVDRVEDVRNVDLDAMVPTRAGHTLNDCVAGEITVHGASVHILIPDRILLAAEKARHADLRLAEQARLDALAPS